MASELSNVVAKTEAAQKYLQDCGILDDVIAGLSKLALTKPTSSPQEWLANFLLSKATEVKQQLKRPLRIVIAGPPASGKGTQCEFIRDHYGVAHISTGDALRAAAHAGTELGQIAKEYMDQGKLVPNDLIISLVKELLNSDEVKQKGWLLDGFPRTKEQAEALAAAGIEPDVVLVLNVPDEKLVDRVVGRRLDPVTSKIYHLTTNPPENDEIRARLIQRDDDTAEKIIVRVQAFHANMSDISAHYNTKMVAVDGDRDKNEVFKSVKEAVDNVQAKA